jgi:hypothetical protein
MPIAAAQPGGNVHHERTCVVEYAVARSLI